MTVVPDPFFGPERERTALNPGGAALTSPGVAPPDYGTCPKCGEHPITRPNALRCEWCAGTAPQGGLGPYVASQPATESSWFARRKLEQQARELREQFERGAVELSHLLPRVALVVEGLRALATTIGSVEQRLTGRAAESIRDESLHVIRQQVADGARKLGEMRV